jgi:hypothetical protein
MATLTTQVISIAGTAPTYGAAAASTKVVCGERTFLHVKNAAGSSMTVTLSATAKVRGQAVADLVVTVPATTGDMMIGPITQDLFAGLSDGLASVGYSADDLGDRRRDAHLTLPAPPVSSSPADRGFFHARRRAPCLT